MNSINIPVVILKRLVLTFMVGTGCFFVSLTFFIYERDTLLLCLGIFLLVMCGIRSCRLFFIGLTGSYTVLEGECREVRFLPLSKYQKILLFDANGESHCIHLEKNCRILPNGHYRLYFSDEIPKSLSDSPLFFQRAASVGSFLGAENTTPSEP